MFYLNLNISFHVFHAALSILISIPAKIMIINIIIIKFQKNMYHPIVNQSDNNNNNNKQ